MVCELLFWSVVLGVLIVLGTGPWAPPYTPWHFGRGVLFIVIVVLSIMCIVANGSPIGLRH